MSDRSARILRLASLRLAVVTGGTAALSWEVLWQHRIQLAFGVSAIGAALTLAATMGGMAVGSFSAGQALRARAVASPLRLYGVLEAIIGLAGLVMLPAMRLLESADAGVYHLSPTLAPLFQVLGIFAVLAPATLAMGATVPVFQLVARSQGVRISTLYGLNTFGAAIGVLLLTFLLLPELGVQRTCLAVAAANFLVSVGLWAIGAPAKPREVAESPPAPVEPRRGALLPISRARVIVFATGFVTFGLEVAWFRAMRSAFWSTSATFAITLAAVLLPLAIGARCVPWIRRRGISPGTLLAAAAIAVLLATPGVERLDRFVFLEGDYGLAYVPVVLTWLLASMALVGPGVLLLATVLPFCLEELPDPRATGQLYGLNTLGSVAGSLAAAWVLLPQLGFARSAWLLALVAFAASLAVPGRGGRVPGLVGAAAALAAAVLMSSSPGRDRMYGRPDFGGNEVIAFEEAPDFTVSVVAHGDPHALGNRQIFIDGFGASSSNLAVSLYTEWMGSLPVLLHPDPKRALVICFGTGRTANAVRREEVPAVDVVDVSSAVFSMAPHFASNEGVLEDRRVHAIVMDGRAWLRRTEVRYDVVTLEPMPPNFSGVNALYSREFYEIVASRLEPGGVVAQWLPIHLVTPEHAAAIVATFREVFPDALLWFEPYSRTGILLGRLAGSPRPLGSDWPGLRRRPVPRTLSPEEIRRATVLDAAGLARYAQGGEVITDDNLLLAWGRMRAGQRGERAVRLFRTNLDLIAVAAERPPYLRDSRSLDWAAPGAAGPRRMPPSRH